MESKFEEATAWRPMPDLPLGARVVYVMPEITHIVRLAENQDAIGWLPLSPAPEPEERDGWEPLSRLERFDD